MNYGSALEDFNYLEVADLKTAFPELKLGTAKRIVHEVKTAISTGKAKNIEPDVMPDEEITEPKLFPEKKITKSKVSQQKIKAGFQVLKLPGFDEFSKVWNNES